MNRNAFLKKIAGTVLLAAPAYLLLNCSSSDDSNDDNDPQNVTDCSTNGMSASTIAGNHGHSLVVTSADVAAGTSKTYNISGSSGHSHSVTISEAQFTALQNSEEIVVNSSSGNSHTHAITVRCA